MPRITIDGTVYEFEGRPKLLQFCLDHGIELPHFCYHPALSIPANCRQCLVEVGMPVIDRETGKPKLDENGQPVIQFMPKLQTSCSLDMADGMVVKTHRTSEKVARAQRDNLEFLLINHPLDCPICDQAGKCPLQIQAYKYGPEGSRFEFLKVHKPKRVKLGPRVMLDAERCINCTRCVRFTDEISKSHQLTIIERGVRNYPITPPGVEFDDPYSMNVIDLCPVGALTSIDARFKARPWEMSATPSITITNAKGSNCYYWVRDNLIVEITARANAAVNGYWLPDEDRLDYHRFNENRPDGPEVRRDGRLVRVNWEEAYDRAAELLAGIDGRRILFLGSAYATVEDNYLLKRLAEALAPTRPSTSPTSSPATATAGSAPTTAPPTRRAASDWAFCPSTKRSCGVASKAAKSRQSTCSKTIRSARASSRPRRWPTFPSSCITTTRPTRHWPWPTWRSRPPRWSRPSVPTSTATGMPSACARPKPSAQSTAC